MLTFFGVLMTGPAAVLVLLLPIWLIWGRLAPVRPGRYDRILAGLMERRGDRMARHGHPGEAQRAYAGAARLTGLTYEPPPEGKVKL
jgi:hypothetical protein